MFQRILVPLDGTYCAEQAIPMAAKIAQRSGASITLMYVLRLVPQYLPYPIPAGILPQEVFRTDEQNAQDYLSRMRGTEDLRTLSVSTDIFLGNPGTDLLQHARLKHINCIVMGCHGKSGLKRFIFGSVSVQILRHSDIPVLIVKETPDEQKPKSINQQPFRILVALDGSPDAEAVLQHAILLTTLLSAPRSGKLTLARIVYPVLAAREANASIIVKANQKAIEAGELYLEATREKLLHNGNGTVELEIDTTLRVDEHVSDALIAIIKAAKTPFDALALVTHGREGISHLMLGSIAEHLLEHMPIPLLVVKQPEHVDQLV